MVVLQVAEDIVHRHRLHADPANSADSEFLQVDASMKSVIIKDKGLLAAARFLQGASCVSLACQFPELACNKLLTVIALFMHASPCMLEHSTWSPSWVDMAPLAH